MTSSCRSREIYYPSNDNDLILGRNWDNSLWLNYRLITISWAANKPACNSESRPEDEKSINPVALKRIIRSTIERKYFYASSINNLGGRRETILRVSWVKSSSVSVQQLKALISTTLNVTRPSKVWFALLSTFIGTQHSPTTSELCISLKMRLRVSKTLRSEKTADRQFEFLKIKHCLWKRG